jgi:uncharacterized membrane protein YgcG
VFAVGVISLAVKGRLLIEEDGDGDFTLVGSRHAGAPLCNDEQVLADALSLAAGQTLALNASNSAKLQAATKALKGALRREHIKQHFITNAPLAIIGMALSAAVMIGAAITTVETTPVALFLMVWLTGWTFGVYSIVGNALALWRQVWTGKWLMVIPALFISAFSLPFVGAELFVFGILFQSSPVLCALLFLLVGINYGFYQWLKAPTRLGRPIYDALAGFRLYLSVAEKDRMNLLNPPEETPRLFEKYLPYALALGVEQQWSERFAGRLSALEGGADTPPGWYRGPSWHPANLSGFSSAMGGAFSSALASSASPPGSGGSSGGGGGGGSSGGGGGGGGGGGW